MHVEHDDVGVTICEHGWQVARVDGRGPPLDQFAELLVVAHGSCELVSGSGGRSASSRSRSKSAASWKIGSSPV